MEMYRSIDGVRVDDEAVTLMEDLGVAMHLVESFGISPDEAMARIASYDAEVAARRGEQVRVPESDESHAREARRLLDCAVEQLRVLSRELAGLTDELRQLPGLAA